MAHSFLALRSLDKGLGKLLLNKDKMAADLDNNWAVCAEAIQTILRRENYPQPYEALKALTRGTVSYTHLDVYKRQRPDCFVPRNDAVNNTNCSTVPNGTLGTAECKC